MAKGFHNGFSDDFGDVVVVVQLDPQPGKGHVVVVVVDVVVLVVTSHERNTRLGCVVVCAPPNKEHLWCR